MAPTKFGIGQSIRRKEDDPLLRGGGRYVADALPGGALHAVLVRSPHAHAQFRSIPRRRRRCRVCGSCSPATTSPMSGRCRCRAAFRASIFRCRAIRCWRKARCITSATRSPSSSPTRWSRRRTPPKRSRSNGEPLPHVVGAVAALEKGAVQVWPDRPGNLAFEITLGEQAATARGVREARAHGVSLTLVNQRLVTNYLDTRGVIAEYDAARPPDADARQPGQPLSCAIRCARCSSCRRRRSASSRRMSAAASAPSCSSIANTRWWRSPRRSSSSRCAWIADRTEHFLGDAQGRDNITTAKLALDDKGRFLALDIDLIADMGAYLSAYAPYIPFLGAGMSPGVYDIPALSCPRARRLHQHRAGRCLSRRRPPRSGLRDRAAGRCRRARARHRARRAAPAQLHQAEGDAVHDARPDKIYDTGDFAAHMARAQEMADWDGFSKRAAASKKNGRCAASGLRPTSRPAATWAPDTATITLDHDGGVTALMGSQSSGQGHATVLRADRRRASRPAAGTGADGAGRHRPRSRPAPAPADRARSRAAARRSTARPRRSPTI